MTVDRDARNASIDFHNRAMALVATDKQLAYRLLCSATTVDPTMAAGWYMLSNATADLKMLPASIAAAERCLQCPMGEAPGDLTPELRAKTLVNLGHRLFQAGRVDEASAVTFDAIHAIEADANLDPEGRGFAYTNMSLILSVKGQTRSALTYARDGFAISPTPIAETGLGFAYLFDGDYANGLKHFDARFAYKADLNHFLSWPYPRWDGSRVGTLFVACDAGMGDTISMARFVTSAAHRVDHVIFQVQSELLRLMTEALAAEWPNVQVIAHSAVFPQADAWIPVMSLPVGLGMQSTAIRNHLQWWRMPLPEPATPPVWKAPGAEFHIGIAYGGSPLNEVDRWRSVPVETFLDLYQVPGVQLYSLQVGDRVQDIHAAGAAALIRDLSPWIRDAMDTAAIMDSLDLVVTIDSFVSHLAGAMGKRCWTLVSTRGGDWRLGRSGDQPLWYENHRLFRQGSDGEWAPVFKRVIGALKEVVQ